LDTYNDLKVIRVKYLDKEDIESLGFREVVLNGFENDNGNTLTIHPKGNIIILSDRIGPCLFDGVIKNKFELKKIMQMLCII